MCLQFNVKSFTMLTDLQRKGRNPNFFQMFFKMYAMQMECFTDFNTKIVKQCLVSTGG